MKAGRVVDNAFSCAPTPSADPDHEGSARRRPIASIPPATAPWARWRQTQPRRVLSNPSHGTAEIAALHLRGNLHRPQPRRRGAICP